MTTTARPRTAVLGERLRTVTGSIADDVFTRWQVRRHAPDRVRPELEHAIRGAVTSATDVVAGYLATGRPPSDEEAEVWGLTGRTAFLLSLTMADVTKLCLSWRDRTIEAVAALAADSGIDHETLGAVVHAIRIGADGSLVHMARGFEQTRRRLEDQLAEKQAHLDYQMLHDRLTGLANRALLVNRLDRALQLAERMGPRPAVVYLDLDRFKAVNDAAGHSAGDHLLVEVGARLRKAVGPGDTVARLGGDEFVVLLEDLADPDLDAPATAERILSGLGEPFGVAGRTLLIGASVGVAVATAQDRAEDVLGRGDRAMYRAKEAGRNRVAVYDPALDRQASYRAELATALHRALPGRQLRMLYQPVLDIATGREVAREALLRWEHPTLGSVIPGELVPLAEETGMIVDIGRWVLKRSCLDAASWRARNLDVGVSVNVSGRQLEYPGFAADVEHALSSSRLEPHALTLELTETLLAAGRAEARLALEALQQLGVRLAIDDFGTGYSSLAWLARLPIDTLKIDRDLVASLGIVDRESTIVRATVQLAHTLGLTVVAEGVEYDRQLHELADIGCDLAQGYLLGRPAPFTTSGVGSEGEDAPAR